jgi:hypothetical protein
MSRAASDFRFGRWLWLYKKLERLMNEIETQDLPMHIKEVYIFGSFIKGKSDPKDVDLLLIYDSEETARKYETRERDGGIHWRMWELSKSPSRLRGRLKRNAERTIDLTICPSVEEFQRDLTRELDLCLRIWSIDDRDWRSNLDKYLMKVKRET